MLHKYSTDMNPERSKKKSKLEQDTLRSSLKLFICIFWAHVHYEFFFEP